jgi:hypothetical protein
MKRAGKLSGVIIGLSPALPSLAGARVGDESGAVGVRAGELFAAPAAQRI